MTKDEAVSQYDKGFLSYPRAVEIATSRRNIPVYRHETDIPDHIRRGLNDAGIFYLLESDARF